MALDWSEFTPITDYKTEWEKTDQGLLTNLADDLFFGIDKTLTQFTTLDAERAAMLKENPDLNIKNLNDGYDLEVERLNAINQKSSKGLQVVDINPGLLDSIDNALSLPFEFIFDGTGFLPSQDGSLGKNFRTVNIPIAGNFLKIEFIYENNSQSNATTRGPAPDFIFNSPPAASIKFAGAYQTSNLSDLTTGQTSTSFDQYARNKVWVDFGPSTGKPHIVPTSGRVFKTYFSELNISLNIGAPKIRVTIGSNSEVYNDSNTSAINARLALTGGGRMLADSDTIMSPFCLTEADLQSTPILKPDGYNISANTAQTYYSFALLNNSASSTSNFNPLGYNVFWITRIYANINVADPSAFTNFRFYFFTSMFGVSSQEKRVHSFRLRNTPGPQGFYTAEFNDPIRVILPPNCSFVLKLAVISSVATATEFTYTIDGYSYGEMNRVQGLGQSFFISKYITDSTFLSDFNRVNCLKDGP